MYGSGNRTANMSGGVYCDHIHLYSFYFTEPIATSYYDSSANFVVMAEVMSGTVGNSLLAGWG